MSSPVRQPRTLALLVLLAAGAAACGATSTQPTPTQSTLTDPYSGAWSGTLTDTVGGSGGFQLTLSQNPLGWGGTWSVSFPRAGAGGSASVLVSGPSKTSPAALSLTCVSRASITSTDVSVASSRMTGSYIVTGSCLQMNHGTFQLVKQ